MRKLFCSALAILLFGSFATAASWKDTDTEDSSVNGGEIVMVENEGGTDNNWMSLSTIKAYVNSGLLGCTVTNTQTAVNQILQGTGAGTCAWTLSLAGIIDDTCTNGDTDCLWSADKIYDQLALKLNITDIDDTPVNAEASAPISSNWAYDHEADTSTHGVSGAVVGTTDSQALSNKTIAAVEVDGSSAATLTAAQVSGTIVTNRGQAASDVALTLPTAAAGYNALFTVGTAQSNKWGVRAGTNDKIYLLAADGTISAGSDNGYARMTAAQVGQAFACWTFQTGSSAWDWQCKAGAIGTSTFAAN